MSILTHRSVLATLEAADQAGAQGRSRLNYLECDCEMCEYNYEHAGGAIA